MTSLMKNFISYGVLALGLLIYFVFIGSYQFIESTIVILITLLSWSIITIYLDTFDTITFSKILSSVGFIFAISFFFFFGVEEVPIPEGAMLFSASGIAVTLFIVFASTLPLLYSMHGYNSIDPVNLPSSQVAVQPQTPNVIENSSSIDDIDDDWEIATEEDLESGNFEVAA
tara:strand:+ start:951 stop:1466 length:516 start_codon:yes stop_codon:yes gene_type:complete